MLQGALVQDFEHVRLVWQYGQVVVGNLGREASTYISCGFGSDDPKGPCSNGLTSNDGTAPQVHALDFARFVQQHGGTAVFGTPLTRVYLAENNDQSGRTYQMQLFTKARLEWHPEIHNPTYRILLGLLGPEVLRARQWL
jgi:hypothetical protein